MRVVTSQKTIPLDLKHQVQVSSYVFNSDVRGEVKVLRVFFSGERREASASECGMPVYFYAVSIFLTISILKNGLN